MYKGHKMGELPPHIFAVGDNAYRNMHRYRKDQCIIIRSVCVDCMSRHNIVAVTLQLYTVIAVCAKCKEFGKTIKQIAPYVVNKSEAHDDGHCICRKCQREVKLKVYLKTIGKGFYRK